MTTLKELLLLYLLSLLVFVLGYLQVKSTIPLICSALNVVGIIEMLSIASMTEQS